METMPLTIELPKVKVTFLKEYATRHNITVSKLMDYLVKQFQQSEEYNLHPDIRKFSGIIPEGVDAKQEYHKYLEEKYR